MTIAVHRSSSRDRSFSKFERAQLFLGAVATAVLATSFLPTAGQAEGNPQTTIIQQASPCPKAEKSNVKALRVKKNFLEEHIDRDEKYVREMQRQLDKLDAEIEGLGSSFSAKEKDKSVQKRDKLVKNIDVVKNQIVTERSELSEITAQMTEPATGCQ